MAGRSGQVPVYAGCPNPLIREWVGAEYVHGQDGMGENHFPSAQQRPENEHAVDELVRRVMEAPGEVTIVAQAPLTNLAVACMKEPRIAENVQRLFVMGGTNGGSGNVTPAAEYNFYVDPEAAKIVMNAGFPLTLVDWNLCLRQAVFSDDDLQHIEAMNTPLSRFFTAVNRKALEFCRRTGLAGSTHPDTLTCALAIDETLISEASEYFVDVETQGELTRGYCSVVTPPHRLALRAMGRPDEPPNARVVQQVDEERFKEMFFRILQP
jgi:purine nucleosidase